MIAVERLSFVIFSEERTLKHLKDGFILDVGIGEMYEHARFRIAIRVDVEIIPSARDASSNELAVILEIHRVERYI